MTMTNVANITATNRLRLEFAYDFQGRRVQKKASHWDSGDWVLDSDSRFVYDGWNLLTVFNSSLSLHTSFMWGLDLSGKMDQAGGIGGLLLAVFYGTPATNCFVANDGNGNITALINTANQASFARYEYSPYGETIRATGAGAVINPFRWSTKFWDEESGLVYYGYRYYNPSQGRWWGRDPETESGGNNLYAFVANCPNCATDALGLHKGDPWPTDVPSWYKEVIERYKTKYNVRGDIDPETIRTLYKADVAEFGSRDAILKSYGNKRNTLSEHRRRGGTRGYVDSRVLIAGGAVSAVSIAVVWAEAKLALQSVREQVAAGVSPRAGSAESHLFDFVRHVDSGDIMWAELDAITYVAASGQTGTAALVTWSAIIAEEDSPSGQP